MPHPLALAASKEGTEKQFLEQKFDMSSSVAFPVQALRKHVTELEAAITVCLGNPDVRPVHKLRTETRRVEALLVLLELVPGLPEHRKETASLVRLLRKLRRAAGEVRDLDVHRKMLEAFAEAEGSLERVGDEGRAGQNEGASDQDGGRLNAIGATGETAAALGRAATELRKGMERKREKAAAALKSVVEARQTKVSRAAESLLHVLKPAQDISVSAQDLITDAESLLRRDGLLQNEIAKLSRTELHTVRKAAKAARYVAESLPDDTVVAAAAQRFEALQEAGGQWHDAWQLARAAQQRFGKGHALTAVYRDERDRKLAAYRKALEATASRSQSRAAKTQAGADAADKAEVMPKGAGSRKRPAPRSMRRRRATASRA